MATQSRNGWGHSSDPGKGSLNRQSKLNEEIVAKIKKSNRDEIYWARKLGVSESTITSIFAGRTWRHVKV